MKQTVNCLLLIYENISPLLSDIECINELDLHNPNLPHKITFSVTQYKVEFCL